MKILVHSAPPWAETGYGVHTRELTDRLSKDHDVDIHSVGEHGGTITYNNMDVYPAGAGKHGEDSIPYYFDKSDADVVFSHHDHWSMVDSLKRAQHGGVPMVLYTILDHDLPGDRPAKPVVAANEDAYKTVVMSKWAEARLKRSPIDHDQITYIPHGVDTRTFAPVTHALDPGDLKEALGVPRDAFLFGMNAANYGPRKNIPSHMEAFSRLVEDYDDVYLYVHTYTSMSGGYDLMTLRESLNLPKDRIIFPNPQEKHHGVDTLTLVQFYNAFDCYLNVTQSESWGMTITEALACGTPCIVANNSAMTEQMDAPHDTIVEEAFDEAPNGLLVNRGAEIWTQGSSARRWISHVDHIEAAMRWAYDHPDRLAEMGKNGRAFVEGNYAWDHVYEEYWKPYFAEVEEDLDGEYNRFYFERREQQTQTEMFATEAAAIQRELAGGEILDAGCGTGSLLKGFEDRLDVTGIGIEYAEVAVEMAREKGLDVRQGDICDLPLMDDSVDTAISQHVIEHVEDDVQALSELARVATDKVVCIVPGVKNGNADDTHERLYDESELDRLQVEFEEASGHTLEYEKLSVSDHVDNWVITVDLAPVAKDEAEEVDDE